MSIKLNINESFICRIWESADEFCNELKTSDGQPVRIINFGTGNHDSGPDYKNAKIQIGEKTFDGDVEIHRDFKGWREHSHKKDSAYNSVILQVVLWNTGSDEKPLPRKKREIPTIILSDHLKYSIHTIWQEIINNPTDKFKLPCYGFNSSVSEKEMNSFLMKLAMERLKMKTDRIKERIKEIEIENSGSLADEEYIKKSSVWKQLLYEFIFEALGYSKNKEQMLRLAQSLKLTELEKLDKKSKRPVVQALLYGCSGLLFDLRLKDDYIDEIKSTWNELKDDFNIRKFNRSEWKFFRLRPQNFPTIRLAYGSQLIEKINSGNLLKEIILQFKYINFDIKDCHKNLNYLLNPEFDKYWSVHYNFGKRSAEPYSLLGKERIHDIINNVLIPVVYLYSIIFGDNRIKTNLIKFYTELKINPKNSVLNLMEQQVFKEKGIKVKSPAAEQGAMQLYNFYCMREKCSDCKCGQMINKEAGFNYRIIFY